MLQTRKTLKASILPLTLVMAFVLTTAWSMQSGAAEKKGIKMPDSFTQQDHALLLNGLGVRKAFGVVSVYVGGLYLEHKSQVPEDIIKSNERKRLVLHFIMDVEKEKIRDAWSEGFNRNCTVDCKSFDGEMKTLNGWMANMKNNEELIFALSNDSVTVTVNKEEKGTIKKENFPQNFLSIFLGPNPPNKALKEGLLGIDP